MNPRTALIVGVIALVIGAAGLIVGISAKNGNTSNEELAKSVQTELKGQAATTAATAGSAKKGVAVLAGQVKVIRNRQANVTAEVTKLRTDVDNLTTDSAKQGSEINQLTDQLNQLQRSFDRLQQRVNNNL